MRFGLVAIAVLASSTASAPAQQRYVAWLADGTRLAADDFPGWPVSGGSHPWSGRELCQSGNPLRFLRDRQASVRLKRPYIELANGDRLCGTLVSLVENGERLDRPQRVIVRLRPPLAGSSQAAVTVRADRIARIVGDSDPQAGRAISSASPPPGTVILADGRSLLARSVRWRKQGVLLLTAEGVVEAAFGEILDLVAAQVDAAAAVMEDNLRAGTQAGGIYRFQTTCGSVLTAALVARDEQPLARSEPDGQAVYYIQPAWADQPLAVPQSQIAWCGCRLADETPLSLLPGQTLANRRLTGPVKNWQANAAAEEGPLVAGGREADVGISTHAYSAIAFDLPAAAKELELAVGLDRSAGDGGCVRCQVLAQREGGPLLWDSGVIQGRDGLRSPSGPIELAGLGRVVLATEFAVAHRPPGADPLDIRDQVVWLAPLVKLDLARIPLAQRLSAVLPGTETWQPAGGGWDQAEVGARWSAGGLLFESVVGVPRGGRLRLVRRHQVTSDGDVVELLTSCTSDLAGDDVALSVNGTPIPWRNNADRSQLRQRALRYGRSRQPDDQREYGDVLAWWWDLAPWRGQEVALELALAPASDESRIVWRGFSIRSPVSKHNGDGRRRQPDVPLASLVPLEVAPHSGRSRPLADAVPYMAGEPIRFLGQPFAGGYGLARGSSVSFALEPEYRRFVALAGCTWDTAGPLRVLIDDRVVWERERVTSLSPAEPIDLAIPPASRRLTLAVGEGTNYGYAAFAEAGFVR